MTWALCHGCGHTKFGAIVPCPLCSVASTGNFDLDILFSDHHIERASIDGFGEVLRRIYAATEDKGLGHFAFLFYVAQRYPAMGLGVGEDAPGLATATALLEGLEFPEVEVVFTPKHVRMLASAERSPPGKRWWQFWKRPPPDDGA